MSSKLSHLLWLVPSLFLSPAIAFAQADPDLEYIVNLSTESGSLISILLTVVVALALLLFFWGLAIFILNADDESKRAEGRQRMVWGIIALFVIVSIWGIILLLTNLFGTDTEQTYGAPTVGNLITA